MPPSDGSAAPVDRSALIEKYGEPRRLPNAVARAARRYVEAMREGHDGLIEDSYFGLLRELAQEAA